MSDADQLTEKQREALRLLSEHPEGLPVQVRQRGTLTGPFLHPAVVTPLQDRGFVYRDGYGAVAGRARITARGKALLERVKPPPSAYGDADENKSIRYRMKRARELAAASGSPDTAIRLTLLPGPDGNAEYWTAQGSFGAPRTRHRQTVGRGTRPEAAVLDLIHVFEERLRPE